MAPPNCKADHKDAAVLCIIREYLLLCWLYVSSVHTIKVAESNSRSPGSYPSQNPTACLPSDFSVRKVVVITEIFRGHMNQMNV